MSAGILHLNLLCESDRLDLRTNICIVKSQEGHFKILLRARLARGSPYYGYFNKNESYKAQIQIGSE